MSGAWRLRAIGLTFGLAVATGLGPAAAEAPSEAWPDLRDWLFADREIRDGEGVIELSLPVRAHDAAIVPLEITALIPQTLERYIKTIHQMTRGPKCR
jgi:predicted secreted protein